jgi:hypothetical protein
MPEPIQCQCEHAKHYPKDDSMGCGDLASDSWETYYGIFQVCAHCMVHCCSEEFTKHVRQSDSDHGDGRAQD